MLKTSYNMPSIFSWYWKLTQNGNYAETVVPNCWCRQTE